MAGAFLTLSITWKRAAVKPLALELFGEGLAAHKIEPDQRFLPYDPRGMPGGERDDIARANLSFGPVVHLEVHTLGKHIVQMRDLATGATNAGLEVVILLPAWLKRYL